MNRKQRIVHGQGVRRGSIPVSTVLRKSVRFFIINIFLIIKNTFQVETWAICCLSDSKTQERGLKELNTKTFLGKPAPQTPLDSACAFGPRLGNRSVFIPDSRLGVQHKLQHRCFQLWCLPAFITTASSLTNYAQTKSHVEFWIITFWSDYKSNLFGALLAIQKPIYTSFRWNGPAI